MLKKMLLGAVAAVIVSAVVVPAAHAASVDIGQIGVNASDTGGVFTATKTGAIINITNLSGDMITAGNFSLTANFNTVTNAFNSGSFSLTGTLRDSTMASLGAITFGGTVTGVTQSGNALNFNFNSVFPGSPTAADNILDSAFGHKGVVQLTLVGAPGGFALGGTFSATGTSTVDITAVPTPTAGFGGLMLLGGLAAARYFRKLNLSC